MNQISKRVLCACVAWAAVLGLGGVTHAAEGIRFNSDVRPILADNCFACHGPDANKRKASLRLDTREGLFDKTPKREPTVVPGKLDKSELWSRITATNLDDRMPPLDSHKELKPEQVATLKRWIIEGAPWQGHWSFVKPERAAVPAKFKTSASRFKVRSPIDAYVLARLERKGLKPNAEADKRSLVRRAFLDLTGLPPAPADVKTFLNDKSPDAYEKLVKKLLASPHYGEHRARYWLDAARYADSHGLHFDNYREMWPYRDWVIKAYNKNMPFDRFTVEQLAGDLLENPDDDQRTATGFERCNMTTNEGGTIEDENLANYANDRVTTLSWVYLGLTMNCAACHDHKFDPISQKDFYAMSAFFRNTKQTGFDKNIRESDLFMVVPQGAADRARWNALPGELESGRKARETVEAQSAVAFTNWLGQVDAPQLPKSLDLDGDYLRAPLNEGTGTNVTLTLDGQQLTVAAGTKLKWSTNGPLGAAPVLTKESSFNLGNAGDWDSREPFSMGAWVFLPKDFKGEGSVIAKMGTEKEKYRGWEMFVRDSDFGMKMAHRWSSISMEVRSNDKAVKHGQWNHLFITYDGGERVGGVKLFVNGVEAKPNRDNNRLEWSIRNEFPLRIGRREKTNELKNVAVQDVRIVKRRLSGVEVSALSAAARLDDLIFWHDEEDPTNAAVASLLRNYYNVAINKPWRTAQAKLATLEFEQQEIRARSPRTLVQEEKMDSMPTAQVLFRGQYDKPKDKVVAATPAVLHAMPKGAPTNRLGLAQWMISRENPLTARVTMNRFWQEVFGIGLVKSSEDFGITGDSPSHPELLDWLAIEFQENGWDVKHMMELIVTSSTYRQSAEVTKEKLEKDPQNRLLSRGPRFRMDGEMVRDYALATSGLMVEKIGGPSVKPYQPEGIWEAVAMPESNTRNYKRDNGEALYRRSMYTFWKRAAPPATMDIFNAPSREVCTVRRERTNTPLQALATLNDPQFVEAARRLAEFALLDAKKEEDALQIMADRLLARSLTSKELSIVKNSLKTMRSYYEKEPEAANQLIAIGESKPSDKIAPTQLAAMTMVANQLMNLDEVLNK
ncbi:MAG TPA: DUF1553 domain-containing protein [Candidatus Acidoferrum sp.]|nr:DUF1553 domain-containing protein [Candidatus Acidoferrum sp.]